MIERLKKLQANKGQFANQRELSESLSTDIALRAEIDFLSKAFLNKTVSGCSNCYMDAYMELLYINLEKAMKKIECQFELLSGAVLKDVNGNRDYMCSNANLTNELALYHLKSNPNCEDQFQKAPEDLKKQLEDYELPELASQAIAARKEADSKNIDKLNGVIESQKIEITNLKSEIETKENRITELEEGARQLTMEQARAENDVRKYVSVLTRIEMIELIEVDELPIEVTDEMTDDVIRDAIVVESEKQDSETLSDSDKELEDAIVVEIADKLKAGTTKTAIRKEYQDAKVGEKNITQRYMTSLLAKADELNK